MPFAPAGRFDTQTEESYSKIQTLLSLGKRSKTIRHYSHGPILLPGAVPDASDLREDAFLDESLATSRGSSFRKSSQSQSQSQSQSLSLSPPSSPELTHRTLFHNTFVSVHTLPLHTNLIDIEQITALQEKLTRLNQSINNSLQRNDFENVDVLIIRYEQLLQEASTDENELQQSMVLGTVALPKTTQDNDDKLDVSALFKEISELKITCRNHLNLLRSFCSDNQQSKSFAELNGSEDRDSNKLSCCSIM